MTVRVGALSAIILASLLAAPANAQIEPLLSGETSRFILVRPLADETNPTPLLDRCPAHPWSVDLLLGLPTGVRVKRFFNDDAAAGWMGEGFAGFELILPMFGGGVRYAYAPWIGRYNVISISPGVDAYLLPNVYKNANGFFGGGGPSAYGLIAVDVDVSWRHVYTDAISGEFGFKIGMAAGLNTNSPWLPVFSWFIGLHF